MSEKSRLVGEKIRRLRQLRQLSQKQAADIVGISQAHLCNIENGRNNVTLENLIKLQELFEVPMAEFFTEFDDKFAGKPVPAEPPRFTLDDFAKALFYMKAN